MTALLVGSALGCAGTQKPTPIGTSLELAPSEPPEPKHDPAPPEPAADVVEKAALPFQALRAADGMGLAAREFFDELATKDAVCIGEQHDNPHDHWAELYVIQEVAQRSAASGREFGLGLEMFQTSFQEYLTDYSEGSLDVDELLQATEYSERWGYPFAYYQPQIDHTVDRSGALVALSAPRERVKRVASGGFEALSERELRLLGGYDMNDSAHHAQFERLMQGHPETGTHHLYATQVLWDESMAQTASAWLGARFPARQLVILAGSAHCHASAIPKRLARRLAAKVVSVKPLVRSDEPAPDAIATELDGYDYAFVMSSGAEQETPK